MYLKRLDILGFKSFAQKTTIAFSSGVTAIVGPNGCGKTNVLDSLRWVLGEQKVSLLRGGKMEEVIFNGSRDLKPLGMAEVTLTVVNNRGVLPTEYSEVQVTRRLFRSGDSEYLLNKVPCRLKDIIDLFVDTGMGAHSYSVIQQDMVEAILSSKAEERRFLFEEAAGITKYKQRKKAALRKLEATEQDFLRLKDIHAEVRTQVNSLYRQHKKAERYQRIRDEIKEWELFLGKERIGELDQDRREHKARLDELTTRRQESDTGLTQYGAELEAARKEQLDIERNLSEVGEAVYKVTEDVHAIERQISVDRERRSNATHLIDKNRSDIAALEERSKVLGEQSTRFTGELAEVRSKLESLTAQLHDAESAQDEADRQLLAVRRAREQENQRLIELEGRLSSGRTEVSNLQEQQTELSTQIEKIEGQITSNSPQQTMLLGELERHQQELDRLTAERSAIVRRQTALKQEMETLGTRSDELAEETATLTASIEACEARRKLLEDMILHFEGHGAGLVTVMEQRERWNGIVGTVADSFVPQEGLETALERSLGDLARCLICVDRSTAASIIAYVRSENKGKIGILVPDPGTLNAAVKRPEIKHDLFVGWLDSLVSAEPRLETLKGAILSRTAVFKPGLNADEILPHLPFGFSAVTTDGMLYHGNLITGGSEESFPLFRRREKVQQQQQMIDEFTVRLGGVRDDRNHVIANMASLRAESSELVTRQEELAEQIEETQKRVGEFDFERRSLVSEFERLERERRTLMGKLETIRSRQTSLGLDFGQLKSLKDELVSSMNEVGSRLGDFEAAAATTAERVSHLQVAVIEARSRAEQIESQIKHTGELLSEITNSIAVKSEEIETATEEIGLCDQRVAEGEVRLKELFDHREKLAERQNSLRGVQAEIMEQVTSREREIKRVRDARESLAEQVHELEIRINTINNEIKTIRDRLLEEYQLDILTVDVTRPNDAMTVDEAAEYLHEQKDRLRNFGAVNLLALEEYRTSAEREKFLSEQINDLQAAKSDLQATISKINVTAKELFLKTFDVARGHFKNLFVELFSGGEADITLVDPSDPLESEIDIVARPRGKKLLSIAQMSGGERALTAISLLFSLYLVKPSPFCILDEIDAPLDDANCHRFLKMIRAFSGQTQFVTITHNKITMEAADNLYGITMELPGVSKLVAVRFNEGGDLVDQADASSTDTAEGADGDEIPESIRNRMTSNVTLQPNEEPRE
ncbi:MAG: chromosome segregation protein SMC [candidate division Zixibacteria bacterium]|nr:chromosome segregation protein SMC [candidate division Zixibacteria bacterium]